MSKSEFLADFKNLLKFTNSPFTNFKTVSYEFSISSSLFNNQSLKSNEGRPDV